MARISGVNIPSNKTVRFSLPYIYGIGPTNVLEICKLSGVAANKKVHELADSEILKIRETIDKNYKVEGVLRSEVSMNIKRLTDLGCYRGLRHRKNLPARGQRTHTNARTRRGKAIPVAGKKKS